MILKKDYDILCYQGRHDILWIGPFSYSPFRHVARLASRLSHQKLHFHKKKGKVFSAFL